MHSMRTSSLLALVLCLAAPLHADKPSSERSDRYPGNKRLSEAVVKAEAQLAKGKDDEAVKILQKLVTQAPTDALAQLELATMLARVGRLAEVTPALEQAVARSANAPATLRSQVLAARAAFALRAGTTQDALAFARQAVAAEANAGSLAALARVLARRGDSTARAVAERASQAGPDSAEAALARGDVALAGGLADEAEAAYRRALELQAQSLDATIGLALALAQQGKTAPALDAAHAAVKLDSHSAAAEAALGLAALAQDPADKAGEAVAAVQQARFLEPESPFVRLMLGRVFESRGQLEQAAAAYAEAGRLDPSWGAPRLAVLGLRLREGDAAGTLTELRRLPEELRAAPDAQLLLGQILLRKGDARAAEAALAAATESLPGSAEAWDAFGRASYETGGLGVAVRALERAVKLAPGRLGYLTSYGRFLAWDGHLEAAQTALEEVTSHAEGRNVEAFLTLGAIYRSLEPPRVEPALAAYQEAQKLEPRNAEAALGIARTYRAGKQWLRAVEVYERLAAQQRRYDAQAQLGIAWCYYRSGDKYKAAFYTGLAARAGADVSGLRDALGKPVWAADELDELQAGLRSKQPGEQARAAVGLARLGRSGVSSLASVLQRRTATVGVRETAIEALRGLGPAARDALPALERLVEAGPLRGGDERESAREKALVEVARTAVSEIRGQ